MWVRTQTENTPYFVVGNSTSIDIYDIRNSKSSVAEHKHFSSESPPINYSIFQTNYSNTSIDDLLNQSSTDIKKMIIGFSPN